jgi:hypothetical protein
MSMKNPGDTIAAYSFLPWLRQGVANTIATGDNNQSVKTRATTHVELTLSGDRVGGGAELTQTIAHDVALYSAGDIVGIDTRAIVRTEPRAWITNFEANYLPLIEFYDEDFLWRYTPAAPDVSGLHLRPWIALVVLTESEFEEGKNIAGRPLPYITVADASVFPPADQLWAWAHVHFNSSLAGAPDQVVSPAMSAVLPRVQAALSKNRDVAYSRLVCPRRLADNTGYHAFVVPVFETGRLAGLGHSPDGAPHATFSAWASYSGKPEPTNYPIYYRWYFRTGSHGDFEYLVRLLKPQPVDKRVGTRDLDVQHPGSNIPGITDPELGGILRLGGALRVPRDDLSPPDLAEANKYDDWYQPYPHPFEQALAKFVNLPDDYAAQTAASANAASNLGPGIDDDPDPLITAPIYGRWHALTQRLLTNRDGTPASNNENWVHQLNLDPRHRVAAHFGANVVETNREEYMNDAWQQIGDVLAANHRIRLLQLAKEVSWRWYTRHLTTLATTNSEHAFSLTAPVASRVLIGGTTVPYRQNASLVTMAYTSTAMRRVIRPRARLMRSLPFDATTTPRNLLARVNDGAVSAAPPKVVPPGVPTVDQAADAASPPRTLPYLLNWLKRHVVLAMLFLLILAVAVAVLIGLGLWFIAIAVLALALLAAALAGLRLLAKRQPSIAAVQSIHEENQQPTAVAQYPYSPNFALAIPGSNVRPTVGATDSPVAARFKGALRDSYTLVAASKTVAQRPAPVALDLPLVTRSLVAAVDPQVTIPRRGLTLIAIPPWIQALIGDDFGEVMAYPRIDLPMYEPLKAISVELFLPNINLIPPNSITLIETNQKFIEAYMVGLNHEFATKLLWREYPADQRGSYFRQFWDVRSFFNSENLDSDQLREKLYDIPELHRWPLPSKLGDHNNRASPGEVGEEAVLVIRGELLKKYPTAVIFAQKAQWATKNGLIDVNEPRSLVHLSPAEEANPPHDKVRTPLYEAKVDPDIYFFGFDLTVPEAKGDSGDHPNDSPGWFFVIKERPGEPRFGLELTRDGALEIFNELTWDDALPGGTAGQFLAATSLGTVALKAPPKPDDEGKTPQYDDDVQVDGAAASSARWAYLLYRAPVMIAIHADEMLTQTGP